MKKLIVVLWCTAFSLFSPVIAGAEETPKNLILLMDVSGSMKGLNLLATQNAAVELVKEMDPASKLEIYSFGKEATLLQPLTSNKELLTLALQRIVSAGYTSLYDSIIQVVSRASTINSGIIVFTDGKDSTSTSTLKEVLSVLTDKKISIHFVTYKVEAKEFESLSTIAKNSNGQVFNVTEIAQLIPAFQEAGREIIDVEQVNAQPQSKTPYILGIASSILSFFTISLLRRSRNREREYGRVEELLEGYSVDKSESIAERQSALTRNTRSILERTVGEIDFLLPPTSNTRVRIAVITSLYLTLLSLLAISALPILLAIPCATVLLLFALRFYIQSKRETVLKEFETDLPSALKIIAAGLGSGLSFLQALESFSSETPSEVGRQFRRALGEIQMGTPTDKALLGVAQRMKSKDLEWAVFAFTVQREVGGSLARILRTTAETIDSRSDIRREVRTLSAEGRLSSYILMMLPVGILVFLLFTRPNFISVFWSEPIGNAMIFTVFIFMAFAWLWIRRLIRIEV